VQSDVTTTARGYVTFLSTQAAAFTVGTVSHFQANQSTVGASSAITFQIGFEATSSLVGATNNFGFYSNIPSASGRYNFYAAGTADNYFAGAVGIGTTPTSGANALVINAALSAATSLLVNTAATANAGVTTCRAINATASAGAGAAVTTLSYYRCTQGTFTGTVTDQYGFIAEANLIGATGNNFGFYAGIPSGAGRYNFYAAGTASNYFAGNVGIGGDASVSLETFASATNWVRNNSAAGIPIFAAYRSNGTIASKTVVSSGDEAGRFDVRGFDGTNFIQLAQINFYVDGTPGTNDMPGRIVFQTTADGASSPTEKMRIDNAGNIYGTTGTTGMTNGFFYIPSAAGAPSGVPTAIAGRVPMYYDTTNNNFYVYNGAWKKVLLA
jgi:hypothetical protein